MFLQSKRILNSKRIKNIVKKRYRQPITDEAVQYAFNLKKESAAWFNILAKKPNINGTNDE